MSQKKEEAEMKQPTIVGIGASAGGLESIIAFFENVPQNSGFAFVIIQHLSPDHKSLMAELLSKHTTMQVVEAVDKTRPEINKVYLLPSKKFMTLKNGLLCLHEKEKGSLPNNSIDLFFESLASELGANAIGIVLSGTGTDGTKGLESIISNGGITIVQDPNTAAFNGMPNSAIGAKAATMVLTPENMAADLIDYLKEPKDIKSLHAQVYSDELTMENIIMLISKVGHDFSHYKSPTLIRRLSKRMTELNMQTLKDYYSYLEANPSEIKIISEQFLINVTQFFRDDAAFDILKLKVIPALLQGKKEGDVVKVWSIACSTGEEAYSLAILFCEVMEAKQMEEVTIKIFATDIDKDALETASAAIYSRALLERVSGQRIAKYFDVEDDKYRVKSHVRKMVLFSTHDIRKDPPFGRMDLVSCRNFLIYIKHDTQKEILKKIHFALNVNGYLFVGPSENIDSIKNSLEEVDKKWKIFKCTKKIRYFEDAPMLNALVNKSISNNGKTKNALLHLGDVMKETILEDTHFAGIYVDLNFDVKQAVGNYKSFIQFPEQSFNFNLLKMTSPDLSVNLGSAMRKAVNDNAPVISRNVKITSGNHTRIINITVKPFLQHSDYQQQFLFVVLNEEHSRTSNEPSDTPGEDNIHQQRIRELENELRETKESLQAIIEELEAAGEEMQGANEEMISTNEELQSTNEELQSLNEELHTVSSEHQAKIRELIEVNEDLNNYFKNSEIGQLLVDRNFVIRKFSPSATKMINLIPTDINRSILDITIRFKGIDFISDIGYVMTTGKSIEKEIGMGDSVFVMKITPYEKQNKTLDGVVINFIDVTNVKRIGSILDAVFKAVPCGILASHAVRSPNGEIAEFEFIACNDAMENDLNLSRKDILGNTISQVFPLKSKELFEAYKKVVITGSTTQRDIFNDALQKWSSVTLVKMHDGVVSVSTDITEKKKAADLIQQNYEELRQSFKMNRKK